MFVLVEPVIEHFLFTSHLLPPRCVWLFASLYLITISGGLGGIRTHTPKDTTWQYRNCFSRGDWNTFQATIQLKEGATPVLTPSRPVAYKLRGEMSKQLDNLMEAGVIENVPAPAGTAKSLWLPNRTSSNRFVADRKGLTGWLYPTNMNSRTSITWWIKLDYANTCRILTCHKHVWRIPKSTEIDNRIQTADQNTCW